MMRTQAILAALAILVCLAIGWTAPPASDPPVAATSMLRLKTAEIAEPGQRARYAVDYLARINPPAPPPRPTLPAKPPPTPPPPAPVPDVATVLRAAITAVVREPSGGLGLVLTDGALPNVGAAGAATGRRVLHVGDTFGDGWRIGSISRREAVLQRRDEQRVVNFFDASSGA